MKWFPHSPEAYVSNTFYYLLFVNVQDALPPQCIHNPKKMDVSEYVYKSIQHRAYTVQTQNQSPPLEDT